MSSLPGPPARSPPPSPRTVPAGTRRGSSKPGDTAKIVPDKLQFKARKATIKITNLSKEKKTKLAFQLKSNRPTCFRTIPHTGFISPRKYRGITIIQKQGQENEAANSLFKLKLTVVDEETTKDEASEILKCKEATESRILRF